MRTKNPRFMITVDQETSEFIVKMAEKHHKPSSVVIVELIKMAMELEDDLYWSKVAEEAEKRAEGKSFIPAETLWKELGLR